MKLFIIGGRRAPQEDGIIFETEVDGNIWALEKNVEKFMWQKNGEYQFYKNFESAVDAINHFNAWNEGKEEKHKPLDDLIMESLELLEIQGRPGNYDLGEYMRGMYNGMELIIANMQEREPVFKPPKEK